MSEPITDYSVFDLNGPAHKQAEEEFRRDLANRMLKQMGLPELTRSHTEQANDRGEQLTQSRE